MHTEMHERYKWAIALLNIQADEQVLEIGCRGGNDKIKCSLLR